MNFGSDRIPKKISPCPIAEAVVELRFESNIPAEVIYGISYQKLRRHFPNQEKLPIMELPQSIRDSDPNLKFNPYFRLKNNENFIFQIGPRSFSISCPKEYKGWDVFSKQIGLVFKDLHLLGIFHKPIRIGLRYISFFENINIFENIKMVLEMADNSLIGSKNAIRSEFQHEDFNCVINLANHAALNNVKIIGSVIDVDVLYEKDPKIMLNNFLKIVDQAHILEKSIFFGIIKEDFLNKFNPEY